MKKILFLTFIAFLFMGCKPIVDTIGNIPNNPITTDSNSVTPPSLKDYTLFSDDPKTGSIYIKGDPSTNIPFYDVPCIMVLYDSNKNPISYTEWSPNEPRKYIVYTKILNEWTVNTTTI